MACGGSKKEQPPTQDETEIATSDDASVDDNEKTEDESASEEEPFLFRDVYGVEYETTINPNIASKPYSDESFVHEGHKLKYTDGDYLLGVDVSHHQGAIDWNKVKADGYDFAILRIGYRGYGKTGSVNADREFENYYKNARAAGLKVGVYFFAQAINETEAKEEADFVLSTLNGRELDLPVVYDPESILDDVARTDNVTGEQFTANTKIFCETIKAGGYDPMIYANMLWEAFELDLEQLSDYPLWYADYEPVPQTPYDFEIWQYTNEGRVPGIDGVCDLDIWIRYISKKEH
jgi:GH25 family lysozyme M1 (1,4-beta-N-acetylmuramidase)